MKTQITTTEYSSAAREAMQACERAPDMPQEDARTLAVRACEEGAEHAVYGFIKYSPDNGAEVDRKYYQPVLVFDDVYADFAYLANVEMGLFIFAVHSGGMR